MAQMDPASTPVRVLIPVVALRVDMMAPRVKDGVAVRMHRGQEGGHSQMRIGKRQLDPEEVLDARHGQPEVGAVELEWLAGGIDAHRHLVVILRSPEPYSH